MHNKNDLKEMDVEQLRSIASGLEIKGFKKMEKEDLVYAILDHEAAINAKNAPERPDKKRRGRPKKEVAKPIEKAEETPVAKPAQQAAEQPVVLPEEKPEEKPAEKTEVVEAKEQTSKKEKKSVKNLKKTNKQLYC